MVSSKFTMFQWWKTALSIKNVMRSPSGNLFATAHCKCHLWASLPLTGPWTLRLGYVRHPKSESQNSEKSNCSDQKKKQLVVILTWRLCRLRCFFCDVFFCSRHVKYIKSIHAQGHIWQILFAWDKNKKHSICIYIYILTYMHMFCFLFLHLSNLWVPQKKWMHFFNFELIPDIFFNLRTIQWHLFAVSRLAASSLAIPPFSVCQGRCRLPFLKLT